MSTEKTMLEDHSKQLKTKISQKHNSLSSSSAFGQKLASSASLCIREESPSSHSTISPNLAGKRQVEARGAQQGFCSLLSIKRDYSRGAKDIASSLIEIAGYIEMPLWP